MIKNQMKNWLIKHKALLIAFGIGSVLFIILTALQIKVLFDNLNDLQYYIETGEVTKEMYKYSIIGLINLIVGVVWVAILLILIWRIIFPDYRTVKNAFFLGELEFLIKMPTSIRKELRKK